MKYYFSILLIASLISCKISAQNLFPNPDFEAYSTCPTSQGQVPLCTNWVELVYSADYMNCGLLNWTPEQTQGAQSGTGYMGFATYGSSNASESLGAFLISPLVAGTDYTISFWGKMTSSGFYTSSCSGVAFYGFNGNPAAGGAQAGVCPASMGSGGTQLAVSSLITNLEWQPYSVTFTAPANFDFVAMAVECLNCPQYIFVDNFSFTPLTNNYTFTTECFGNSTNFQSPLVTGIDSLVWNFDDPTTGILNSSLLQNPSHLFSSAGNYDVQLIHYFTNGSTDTITNVVSVNANPIVNLGNDTLNCAGQLLTLNAGNSGATYLWSSGATTQTITVGITGNYSVTVTNGSCSDDDTIAITIGNSNTLNIGNDTILCNSQSLTLNAGNPGSTYLWSTGATTQSIIVNTAATYSVTVTNVCGTLNDAINITTNSSPVFVLGNDTTYCNSFSVQLNAANTGSTYLWSNSSTIQSITVNQAGTYWVNISNNCGIIKDTIIFTQTTVPQVSLGNDTLFCSAFNLFLTATNVGSSYLWSSGATTSTINTNTSGTYSVAVTNACGTALDSIIITQASLPVSLLGNDTLYCSNFSRVLNGGSNTNSYLWSDASSNSTLTITQAGIYSVQLNNICGILIDSIQIIQAAPPIVNLGSDTTFCGNVSLSFDINCVACSYLWSDNSTTAQVTINNPGITIVAVSNLCGTALDSINLQLIPLPIVTLPVDVEICETEGFTILASTNASNILWSTGDTTLIISIPQEGVYSVSVSNACGTDSDSIIITKCPGEYLMPTAFSPNGDGVNDFLFPIQLGDASLELFEVYNRWGQQVYTLSNGKTKWDGLFKNRPCDIGAYVYVVKYKDNVTGKSSILKGSLTLLR
jgi:gliding motility-associated-like protein